MAIVAASDLYVGYDSAFQHIAAALAVPSIDVFVGFPNALFAKRWRPWSRAEVTVIEVAGGWPEAAAGTLDRVLVAAGRHREAATSR